MKNFILSLSIISLTFSCSEKIAPVLPGALTPEIITEPTEHDTDDPAIWINPNDFSKSLIIGTDKEVGGGLYVYDLDGKIVHKFLDMQRPNNVDVAYGLNFNGKKVDIAVTTERKSHKIRVFSLPDLNPIDNGGIEIFESETGEGFRDGMGIALYTNPNGEIHAIVGRKTGPSENYLWQYKLADDGNGKVVGEVVRKFGKYSGKKEIEAIAVDNELGFVYYSDEQVGVRKYHANPEKGNEELAFFAQKDAKSDHEGIAIYKKDDSTGYILVSNQQRNTFLVYEREGHNGNPNDHQLIAEIPVSTIECDGADASSVNFGPKFPNGFLVAMSNPKLFHLYEWNKIQTLIDQNYKP